MLIDRRTVLRAGGATAVTIAAGPVLARDWGDPPPVRYPDRFCGGAGPELCEIPRRQRQCGTSGRRNSAGRKGLFISATADI